MLNRPVGAVDDKRRRARDLIVAIAGEHVLPRRIEKYPAEWPLYCFVVHDDEIVVAWKLSGRFSCDLQRVRLIYVFGKVLWVEHNK